MEKLKIKTEEELSPRTKEILARVEESLRKEVALGKKYGFDVRKHWNEMLASLKDEKVEVK